MEEDALLDAVQFLDEKMQEIRRQGQVYTSERCAIMAALNISNELLLKKNQTVRIQKKIAETLAPQEQLPL